MKRFITQTFTALLLTSLHASGQCPQGTDSVYIEVTTTNRGYEVYWELLPDTNVCGNGTIFAGGNVTQMDCNSSNANATTPGNGYPNNTTIAEGPFCLTTGSQYSIRTIDDYGNSDNFYAVKIKGQPVYVFHSLENTCLFPFYCNPPKATDMSVKKVSTVSYITSTPVSISGQLFNYSYNTVQSLDIHYSINNGPVNTDHVSGLQLLPYTSLDFIHSTLFNPPSYGTYDVKLWADNINGNNDENHQNDTAYRQIATGPSIPHIVDLYLQNTPVFTQIADVNDQLDRPTDLDFHTVLSRNELWVVNYSNLTDYGSTVTFYNAGTPNQVALYRQDQSSDHFMLLPTALAFGDNTNWANSAAILDAHMGSGHFAGPVLWSSDSLVYCQPAPGPLGSHLDMLHQSPNAMGIAAEHENQYWVYDGYNQCITWYDFAQDHGPGFDDHTDGLVRRYMDFTLERINDTIPSHIVKDESGNLYIVDNGNARVIKMDTQTGSVTGSFVPYQEYVTEHSIITGTTWSDYITTGLVQPSGIEVIGNRLLVSDFSNGDIIIYDNTGATGVELGRIHTGNPGIAGIKVGPDGKIWYVNFWDNKVFRVDGITVGMESVSNPSGFSLYPNPASSMICLRNNHFDQDDIYTASISDISGRLIRNFNLTSADQVIPVSDLKNGVYVMHVQSKAGTFTEKFVISR